MQTLVFLLLAFLPPLLSGPLPALLVFKIASGTNWRGRLPIVAFLAIILNLIAITIMIFQFDGLLPPGFIACGLTPMVAVVTSIVSLRFLRRIESDLDADPIKRRWLQLSVVAIAALQILMVIILIVIAPSLCNTEIRTCTDY